MDSLFLASAPPLDPAWLSYEAASSLGNPSPPIPILEKQSAYASACRALTARLTAPGARDHNLIYNTTKTCLTVPSSQDEFPIPVIKYTHTTPPVSSFIRGRPAVVLYIHGGGLYIGEADSEELSILRVLAALPAGSTVYSVGYRLMPVYTARTALGDCLDVFSHLTRHSGNSQQCDYQNSEVSQTASNMENAQDMKQTQNTQFILVGSSSGGQLAALISQTASPDSLHGVLLRGPVTSDAFSGDEYVPARLRWLHTSAREPSFYTSLLGVMERNVPRDGLERMPLEAREQVLSRLPRTWIQVCTNDSLYSDGVCYAKALEDAGVDVRVDVIKGWPHTFWLVAPELDRSLQAEEAMLQGLRWILDEAEGDMSKT